MRDTSSAGGAAPVASETQSSTATMPPSSLRAPVQREVQTSATAPTGALDAEWSRAEPADADPSGVVVCVRDPDGLPVPGAQVEFIARGPRGSWTCDTDG